MEGGRGVARSESEVKVRLHDQMKAGRIQQPRSSTDEGSASETLLMADQEIAEKTEGRVPLVPLVMANVSDLGGDRGSDCEISRSREPVRGTISQAASVWP